MPFISPIIDPLSHFLLIRLEHVDFVPYQFIPSPRWFHLPSFLVNFHLLPVCISQPDASPGSIHLLSITYFTFYPLTHPPLLFIPALFPLSPAAGSHPETLTIYFQFSPPPFILFDFVIPVVCFVCL